MAMIDVSKGDFFRAIGGPENIHPRCERDRSVWEVVGARNVVGITTPGYVTRPGELARYMLDREFAARKGIKEQPNDNQD